MIDRRHQARLLLDFAAGSRTEHGFGWLDALGRVGNDHPLELWINARMTYVFARAARELDPAYAALAEHGLASLAGGFSDPDHGGWFSSLDHEGRALDADKQCYAHAFVILAAATAKQAGLAGADALLADALDVHSERWWDDRAGWCRDTSSRDWSRFEDYRGANAAMHTVEAWLAAHLATGEVRWAALARRQADAVMAVAAENDWRIIEHFDATLSPLPDYNRNEPRHPFRPFGATPGHAFEWARLLTELDAVLPTDGLAESARALFDRAVADAVTAAPGLPYTTDWDGVPVVAERFHWVMTEAVMAAEALARTGHPRAPQLADRWWGELAEHFLDPGNGSWIHELGPRLESSATTWRGRPDAYHALNALLHDSTPIP